MKNNTKTLTLKFVIIYFVYLLLAWGSYRIFSQFQLSEEIEEIVLKPIVWLLPLFYIVFKKEKQNLQSLGITTKNLFPAVYFSFALGAVFAIEGMIVNFLKHGSLNFGANLGEKALLVSFGLSLATAFSEEIAFRGYIFNRIATTLNNEILANALASLGWAVIHMPITFFVWKMNGYDAFVYLFLTTIFGIGASFVFARTRNVFSSIFLHVLWQWPIILFR